MKSIGTQSNIKITDAVITNLYIIGWTQNNKIVQEYLVVRLTGNQEKWKY